MKEIKLIPYVCSLGGRTRGSEMAALDLYEHDIVSALEALGQSASWYIDPRELYQSPWGERAHKNRSSLSAEDKKEGVLWHCAQLRQAVIDVLEQGALPVTFGGDHAMALGSISALAQQKNAHGKTGVIWIDAHADFNTPLTSPSGNLHGMPLAALSGLGDADVVALNGARPSIDPRHIVYIGLRDVDAGEKDFIAEYNINAFTMMDIEREGLAAIMDKAAKIAANGTDAVALSLDLDAFDPQDAPSVGTPVDGGLRQKEMLPLLAKLVKEVKPDLIEIAEYNPTLQGCDITRALILEVLPALLPARA
jgi:arginase